MLSSVSEDKDLPLTLFALTYLYAEQPNALFNQRINAQLMQIYFVCVCVWSFFVISVQSSHSFLWLIDF